MVRARTRCILVYAVQRLAVNRLRTVVPLIDCFCHLATVKGFGAIVPFNYGLNYLSRSPVFLRGGATNDRVQL